MAQTGASCPLAERSEPAPREGRPPKAEYDRPVRVALVHDWLTGMRGGEKALEVLCELFPAADLFTLVQVPGTTSPTIEGRRVVRSPIQWLPSAGRYYRHYLPLFPFAIEQFDLDRYDLVDQHQPLRRQVGGGAPGGPGTSATATRPCGTRGTSSTPTSDPIGGDRWPAGCCGRCWRAWPAGTARPSGRVHRYLANLSARCAEDRAVL